MTSKVIDPIYLLNTLLPVKKQIKHYLLFFNIMEQKKKIYNRIKANLALHQVKNKELAEHLGVSVQTVSKWCTNYSQPSVPQLFEIAVFLQVPVPELLEPVKLR